MDRPGYSHRSKHATYTHGMVTVFMQIVALDRFVPKLREMLK